MTIWDPRLTDAVEALHRMGLRRSPPVIDEISGLLVRTGDRELVCFCSNDYLGMARRSEPVEAVQRTAEAWGWGSGASRLMCGTTRYHLELENRIARFKRTESALLFPSAYMANLAMVSVLCDGDSLVLSDRLNHASLIDACRLSRARVEVYDHADVDSVCGLLRRHADVGRKWILTDGLFSMDGDLAPLRELTGLARYHGAEILLDDVHGTGILGTTGRGTAEAFGVERLVAVQSGGFGKAFGGAGGFVTGTEAVVEHLRQHARTFWYTTAPPPAVCEAARTSIDLVEGADGERARLRALSRRFREGLARQGRKVPGASDSPIVPVFCGSNRSALEASGRLWEAGFFVPAIRPPTVPEGESRLRVSLSVLHEERQVDGLLAALEGTEA